MRGLYPMAWRLLALGALWVLGGCSEERSTSNSFPDPRCLPFPWEALATGLPGETPPDLSCDTTVECPPPLSCRVPRSGGSGTCTLIEDVPDPSAPSQVYDVPEFLLSVTEGDDYNLIEFTGLPPSATVLRCSFHICPPDDDVLIGAPGRCLYDSKIVNLGLTNSLALSVVVNGPDDVSVAANIPACAPDEGEDRPYKISAVGYYAICYAFDETSLIAVSAISNLSRSEIGSAGQDAYHSDCEGPDAEDGVGCSYVSSQGSEGLGVCVAGACCGSCWSDKDCERIGGSTCRQVRDISAAATAGGGGGPPLAGFCSDAQCGNRNGVERCITRAGSNAGDGGVPDGGVPDGGVGDAGTGGFVSFWQANEPPAGFGCDGESTGVGGGNSGAGITPDMMLPPDGGAAADMGPRPDGGPAPDGGPPPDLGLAADAGPPPDMGMAPDDGPIDAEVPDRRPPRMP